MAATISANSAGGGGLVTSGDASGVLALQTAGVTALSIDASQKVTFANPLTSPTLTSPTLTSPTLTSPTIDSAQVLTVSGTAPLYMCRAWVNFNGATGAIRASGNVSSVTRTGVGDYTVNFTTAMPDANYSASITWRTAGQAVGGSAIQNASAPTVIATGSVRISLSNSSSAAMSDGDVVAVAIFR